MYSHDVAGLIFAHASTTVTSVLLHSFADGEPMYICICQYGNMSEQLTVLMPRAFLFCPHQRTGIYCWTFWDFNNNSDQICVAPHRRNFRDSEQAQGAQSPVVW